MAQSPPGHGGNAGLCFEDHTCPACEVGQPCVDLFSHPICGMVACTAKEAAVALKAKADQIRAAIRDTMATPCKCGDCPTDEQLQDMLDASDEDLMAAVDRLL